MAARQEGLLARIDGALDRIHEQFPTKAVPRQRTMRLGPRWQCSRPHASRSQLSDRPRWSRGVCVTRCKRRF